MLVAFAVAVVPALSALANPIGPSGVQGITGIQGLGTSEVIITQGDARAIINWQQFNIAPNEVTRFIQPSTSSLALNRILDQNPSQIFGSLRANGSVILLNPNGVLFGPNAQVNVNGLIAASLNLSDENFLNGRYQFEGSAVNGAVKNAGTITTGTGGFVYLFAPNIENSGVIRTPEGHITLAAGTTAYLSDRPDGRGFLVAVTAPAGEALNLNTLTADGGRINLYGQVINQAGLIQANTVREKNGRIELVANKQVNIKSGSRIEANGAGEGVSDGGTVVALADKNQGRTKFEAGAVIDASGGADGGNGGTVELSGHDVSLGGRIDIGAVSGYRGGRVLIDPTDIDLSTVDVTGASELDFTSVDDLRVTGFLDLTSNALPTGQEGTVRFTAGKDLLFNSAYLFNDFSNEGLGSTWNYTAHADNDLVLTGSWLFTGRGGAIDFSAGRDLKVLPSSGGLGVNSYLRTLAGGNIHLEVGQDLIAPSVLDPNFQNYAGIGLDGPGNLTMNVGRNVLGDGVSVGPGFTLANGTATVTVGGDFGTQGTYGLITLGSGKIHINAVGSIYLGRVQDKGLSEGSNPQLTADPSNAVDLESTGGNIHLNPQVDRLPNLGTLQEIYPASFRATATSKSPGQGNVIFDSRLVRFWPSPTGSLDFSAFDTIRGRLFRGLPTRIELVGTPLDTLKSESLTDLRGLGAVLSDVQSRPPSGPYASISEIPLVSFKTLQAFPTPTEENSDHGILSLEMDFYTPLFPKKVTIDSANDIKGFLAFIPVPQGETSVVKAAGKFDMTRLSVTFPDSGLTFIGTGTGSVVTGGDLDLGNSRGIAQQVARELSPDRDAGGLLDIAVDGTLDMLKSTIWTYNGASIRIHGPGDTGVGGKVNVGGNTPFSLPDQPTGIGTQRGGSIAIDSVGSVEVNLSRVATFGGGDIHITSSSSSGDINAGSGGRNDRIQFALLESITHNDQTGADVRNFITVTVPGSGIFTFHPDDPNPLPDFPPAPKPDLPPFAPVLPSPPGPNVQAEADITKQEFLGHDTAGLKAALKAEYEAETRDYEARATEIIEAQYREYLTSPGVLAAIAEAERQYEVIRANHIAGWKLGNIGLDAGRDVVVPPAGIRGRRVVIKATGVVDLQGGEIHGDTQIDSSGITGQIEGLKGPVTTTHNGERVTGLFTNVTVPTTPSIPPVSSGGSSLGGLSGSTGSVSTTASAATTVAEVVAKAEEATNSESASQAGTSDGEDDGSGNKKGKKTRMVRLKHGVTIEVEVSADKPQ